MKKILIYCAFGAFVLLAESCKKEEAEADVSGTQACASTNKDVKTVTNAAGIVYYNASNQEYKIYIHQPGTYDSVDIGVVCGTLPTALQADGTPVTVTGTFKEYDQAPPQPLPAGTSYYHLEVSAISRR